MKKFSIFFVAMFFVIIAKADKIPFTKIDVNGVEREFVVYVPQNIPDNAPVVISIHGNNNDSYGNMEYTHFTEIADTAMFIAVFPNALDSAWNVTTQVDREIAFINSIIDYMTENYSIDANRIYLVGHSWGGVVACQCMNPLSERIAAFGLSAAHTYNLVKPSSIRHAPFVRINGTLDVIMNYFIAVQETKKWAKYYGLSTTPETISPYPVYSSSCSLSRYTGEDTNVEIWFYTVNDGGHSWNHDEKTLYEGIEIWNFCKKFSLTGDTPTGVNPINAISAGQNSSLISAGNSQKTEEYNLQGLRTTVSQKGIIIKEENGKMVKVIK